MDKIDQVFEALAEYPAQVVVFDIPYTLPEGRWMFEFDVDDANGRQSFQTAHGVRGAGHIKVRITRHGG